MRPLALIIAINFVLTGCGANKQLQLPLTYHTKTNAKQVMIEKCHSNFFLSDKRKNHSLGQMSGQAVLADKDIKIWFKQAVFQEFGEQLNIQWVVPNEVQSNQWIIELKKAYVMNQTTNMAATTVFLLRNNESGFRKIFRGNVTHTNWNSGVNETMTVLNASLKNGLEKMRVDIVSACQSSSNV